MKQMRMKTSLTVVSFLLFALIFSGCGGGGSSTPDGLTDTAPVAPSGLKVTQATVNSVTLAWNATSGDVFSYTVYRNGIAIGHTSQAGISQPSAPTTYTDTNRTAGTLYTYAVSASSLLGNESPKSSPVNAVTLSSGSNTNGGYTLKAGETIPVNLTTSMISGKIFYWAFDIGKMYGQITFPLSASGVNLPGVYSLIAPSAFSNTTSWVATVIGNAMPIVVTESTSTGTLAGVDTLNIVASGPSYYVVSQVVTNVAAKIYLRLYYGSTALADAKVFSGN